MAAGTRHLMRIIAGRLGGRSFSTPRGTRTHPMSDKIRGALFNALGDVEGLTVLDAFAGSGALGFEAISRGAASITMIELDLSAAAVIKRNIEALGVDDQAKLIQANCSSWSDHNSDQKFDLVFCDPPYDKQQTVTLRKIAGHTKPGGVAVFSLPPKSDFELPATEFELLSRKNYGDATLTFYRKTD